MYVDTLHEQLLADPKTKSKVMKSFKSHPLADKVLNASCDTVCRLAAQKLSQLIFKFRKEQVSSLLGSISAVKWLNITNSDMGPSYHLFYQSRFTMKQIKIPVV